MIRVSVLYPAKEGATFDHDYYARKHMPNYTNVQPQVQISEIVG